MAQYYFVVLELPHGKSMKFLDNGASPEGFWHEASNAIRYGKVTLVCKGDNTGLSDEITTYAAQLKHFTTFLLLEMQLDPTDFCKPVFYHKAAKLFEAASTITVIHTEDNFQILAPEN